jgi:hypothetical protein
MTRRIKGEGSIQQLKNGRWRCRITVPGGKQIAHTARTYKEAVAWLRKTSDQVNRGLVIDLAAARQDRVSRILAVLLR